MFPAPRRSLALVGLVGLVLGCNTQHFTGKLPREQQPDPSPATPRPLPQGTDEGVPEHLLHEYAEREPATELEIRTWQLPFQAKRIAVALLTLAARDDMSTLPELFSAHARWGFPDRREYDARPIFADGGREFFDTFRTVASRFARKEAFFCPPVVPPAAQFYVRSGAEPMWCAYLSRDGVDVLAFKFVYEGGSAKIDYIGMTLSRGGPARGGPKPPPMTPQIKRGLTSMPIVQVEQSGGGDASSMEIIRRDPPPGALPRGPAPVPGPGPAPTPGPAPVPAPVPGPAPSP